MNPLRRLALLARALLPAGLFALSLFGVLAGSAQAQANAHSKVARDLEVGIAS